MHFAIYNVLFNSVAYKLQLQITDLYGFDPVIILAISVSHFLQHRIIAQLLSSVLRTEHKQWALVIIGKVIKQHIPSAPSKQENKETY